MEEKTIEKFGTIHKTIWGDAHGVIKRLLTVQRAMLVARGATEVTEVADPIHAITHELGHVITATSEARRWDVYIHAEDRIGVRCARAIVEECEANGGSHAIVVSIEGPTPFTRRECDGKRVQFFLARDVCVNIVDHCLVPRHERVDAPPEGVLVEELPRMETTDRIAQYYDWPAGTIVKITRVFGGHEPIPYYRAVVGSGGA